MSEDINKPNEDETAEVSAEDLKKIVGGFESIEHGTQTLSSSVQKKQDDTASAVIGKI